MKTFGAKDFQGNGRSETIQTVHTMGKSDKQEGLTSAMIQHMAARPNPGDVKPENLLFAENNVGR